MRPGQKEGRASMQTQSPGKGDLAHRGALRHRPHVRLPQSGARELGY